MKKKVLFMVINMNVGGTEKALLNMIEEMEENQYDVTIYMLEEYGGFLDQIPKWVKIKVFPNYEQIKDTLNDPPKQTILANLKKKNVTHAFRLLLLHIQSKLTKERSALFRYLLKQYPIDSTEYDIAVAYAGPMDFISYFVLHKIKAKKKVQWIHFDITKIGFNISFAAKHYKKFDNIFVVSKEGKKKLIEKVPFLQHKIETFYNVVPVEQILKLSKENGGFDDDFQGLRILTVGRLSKEKGQDLTISAMAKLKREGYNVRWYCIGEGNARQEYESLIKEHNLEKDYVLLGNKINPYPYMAQCDIYVQSSRHEGYCITLAEVKCFHKPIISTKVNGVTEHIQHEESGIVIEFDEEELFLATRKLIVDRQYSKDLCEKQYVNDRHSSFHINEQNEFKVIVS